MLRKLSLYLVLAGMTLVPVEPSLRAFQSTSATKATTTAPAASAPSDKDIADAKGASYG